MIEALNNAWEMGKIALLITGAGCFFGIGFTIGMRAVCMTANWLPVAIYTKTTIENHAASEERR